MAKYRYVAKNVLDNLGLYSPGRISTRQVIDMIKLSTTNFPNPISAFQIIIKSLTALLLDSKLTYFFKKLVELIQVLTSNQFKTALF